MKDGKVVSLLKSSMRQAIQTTVYDFYTPTQYKRRGDNGGLLDENAMRITDALMSGKNFKMVFENLSRGADTVKDGDVWLSDVISQGLEEHWQKTGIWSQPRDFVTDMADSIRANPQPIIEAIKSSFRAVGFKVK